MCTRRLNAADAPGKVKRAALSMFTGAECRLRYLEHALRASLDDRYGDLSRHLPRTLDLSAPGVQFVEVELDESGRAEKVVGRMPTSLVYGRETVDLVLVVMRGGMVKTVWGNVASDKHRTLNRARLH